MKIHALHIASYGKIADRYFSFSDGLNYIYGPNEAGKTTLMACIKAMLYGFTGRGADSDRKRYMPWNGSKMTAEMEVSLSDGTRVIIHRTSGRTPAQDVCKILDGVTGEERNIDISAEIGVGESGFLKTVYVRQAETKPEGGDKELTDKLINLATSGDAAVGYENAMALLRKKIRYYQHQRGDGGYINDLKKKITAYNAELERSQNENRAVLREITAEKVCIQEITRLEKQIANAASEEKAAMAWQEKSRLSQVEHVYIEVQNKRVQAETELQGLLLEKAQYKAFYQEADGGEIPEVFEQEIGRLDKIWFPLSVALLLMGIGTCFLHSVSLPLRFCFAALFGAVGVIVGSIGIHTTKKKQKANNQKENFLAYYGCNSIAEYAEKKSAKLTLENKITFAEKNLAAAKQEEKAAKERFLEQQATFEAAYGGIKPLYEDPMRIREKTETLKNLYIRKKQELARIQGILQVSHAGIKVPDLIETKINLANAQLFEAKQNYAALLLAQKTLEDVFVLLSRDFTPRVNTLASSYFSEITGAPSDKLLIDKAYNVTMQRDTHRPISAFSSGTVEQAYLAVRLAVAALVLQDGTPLFLDDSFLLYDSAREKNILLLLEKLAEKRQIFLFSCRPLQENKKINLVEL